jgi:hypothetical protein
MELSLPCRGLLCRTIYVLIGLAIHEFTRNVPRSLTFRANSVQKRTAIMLVIAKVFADIDDGHRPQTEARKAAFGEKRPLRQSITGAT